MAKKDKGETWGKKGEHLKARPTMTRLAGRYNMAITVAMRIVRESCALRSASATMNFFSNASA